MNVDIERLLTLTYEYEGLLALALRRDDCLPPDVWSLLAEKAAAIHGSTDKLVAAAASTPAPSLVVGEVAVPEPVEEPAIQVAALEEAAATVDERPDEAPAPIVDDEAAEEVEEEDTDATVGSTMRLDEKLARENSRNLRRAFSVNDRFRFRRELFGNSDIEMSDTINLVEAMSGYDEALDYFITDLQWDEENPEVRDFLSIIEHHFATR